LVPFLKLALAEVSRQLGNCRAHHLALAEADDPGLVLEVEAELIGMARADLAGRAELVRRLQRRRVRELAETVLCGQAYERWGPASCGMCRAGCWRPGPPKRRR
jgi:hypothetical protein